MRRKISSRVSILSLHWLAFLCAVLVFQTGRAATINFEKLPDNSDPVDNLHLPLDYVFQDGRTGLSFGIDTDGDNVADDEAVIEQRGNADYSATEFCWAYTDGGTTTDADSSGTGEGGTWFVREKKICNADVDANGTLIDQNENVLLKQGNKFVVTYSYELPTSLAGQIWDLDFGETFLAEAYSEAGALIASQTIGPYCSAGGSNVSLDECLGPNQEGLGTEFGFDDLATPVKRLVISFVETNSGGGFAFDNFNGTQAFVDVTQPHNPDDDDGDGQPDATDNCPLDDNPNQDDTDQDTVGDVCDICANTPPDSIVITDPYSPLYGCVDNDGDGINNDLDQCPDTPDGNPVNNEGCTDTDGDSVPDTDDQCPNTPDGDPVNTDGCTDTDGDSVPDTEDSCPNVPNLDQEDSDGNGIGDACESVPVPATSSLAIVLMALFITLLAFLRGSSSPARQRP